MDFERKLPGIYRAIVHDNRDPKKLRRLKVKVTATGEQITNWIWPVISTKRPPAIGTGVYVMYIGGDPEYPVWIGEFGEAPQGVFAYGSWFSTIDQTAASTSTQYIMTVNSTDYSEGISVVNSSKFTVQERGTYNLQFSAQLQHRTGGGGGPGDNIWIWLKKNGSNVANSATKLYIPTVKYQVASWNFYSSMMPGDYLELAWYVDTTDIAIEANGASGPSPAVPSLIVTMNQIA